MRPLTAVLMRYSSAQAAQRILQPDPSRLQRQQSPAGGSYDPSRRQLCFDRQMTEPIFLFDLCLWIAAAVAAYWQAQDNSLQNRK